MHLPTSRVFLLVSWESEPDLWADDIQLTAIGLSSLAALSF